MRFWVFAVLFAFSACFGRSFASIKRDAFTVGVSKGDSAAEYDFIAEITAKMKLPRFRLVCFDNANLGQKMLLEGKIDVIIAKINYSKYLENDFLVSAPYGKTEIAVASLANNDEFWTLERLGGKNLAFITKDVLSEQILSVWQSSKPVAFKNMEDAITSLKVGETQAIVANRQTLESLENEMLQIFPNSILENNLVALFAPNAKSLKELFDLSIRYSENSINSANSDSDKKRRIEQDFKDKTNKNYSDRIENIIRELEEIRSELK